MSIYHLDQGKIRPEHRERAAYVYVRQSSPTQVREHQESRRRQYAFAEQARALGWSDPQVVTVDEDQGRSGALPQTRAGFGRLVTAVARGEVGIVLSLELARLSRNDPDWHRGLTRARSRQHPAPRSPSACRPGGAGSGPHLSDLPPPLPDPPATRSSSGAPLEAWPTPRARGRGAEEGMPKRG